MTRRWCSAVFFLAIGCKGGEPEDTSTAPTDTAPSTDTEDTEDTEPAADWECVIEEPEPDYSLQIGCAEDFDVLASDPLDASIPGARSTKTVVDRSQGDALYFTNSNLYPIHYEFCFANLSGDGLPLVTDLGSFNTTEYYSPDRRFLLGAISYYEEPAKWVYELAPYDTSTADMIATAFYLIRDNSYFGDELYFHPSSEALELEAANLPDDVPVITTEELFAGITYQPLNLGTSMGLLTFYEDVENDFPWYREIVVLDGVPNDISVVAGIVTSDFQTPLSHINVLSQNRGTPNMALTDAFDDPTLRDLEGKWVELTVDPLTWTIREVTQEEADAWWDANRPEPIVITPMDTSITDLIPIDDVLDLDAMSLADALPLAVPAFGGKASQYAAIAQIGDDVVPVRDGFVVPVAFYNDFMTANGLWDAVDAMVADKKFAGDPEYRNARLQELRDAIEAAPVDPAVVALVTDRIWSQLGGERTKFRSSTNAEDLGNFNGAGLYESKAGDVNDPSDPIDEAMKAVWASTWNYRAYEEREYYGIDHLNIGMALLVHPSFTDEEANGVAITSNIYDLSGLEPGFYVNVQVGEESVVFPEAGVTTDQFIYYFYAPGQPIVFIENSNLVDDGDTVLTVSQTYELGTALEAIHNFFYDTYGVGADFYGMDVEFKFDDLGSGGTPELWIKQARPYPGWGG
jgi:hypothetical protein